MLGCFNRKVRARKQESAGSSTNEVKSRSESCGTTGHTKSRWKVSLSGEFLASCKNDCEMSKTEMYGLQAQSIDCKLSGGVDDPMFVIVARFVA